MQKGFSFDEVASALRAAEVGVFRLELTSGALSWGGAAETVLGLSPTHLPDSLDAYLEMVLEEDRTSVGHAIAEVRAGRTTVVRLDHRICGPDGMVRTLAARGGFSPGDGGSTQTVTGTIADIGERLDAQIALRQSEERYRLFTELASDYVYDASVKDGVFLPEIVAGAFERTTGFTLEQVAERGGWMAIVHPEDRERLTRELPEIVLGRPFVSEYRIIDADGAVRWLRDRAMPIADPVEGQLSRIVGGVQDVTERHALEGQLLHAQKMEALAQLAGSVAHDFNNLLTIVFSSMSMLEPRADAEPIRHDSYAWAMDALKRAAELTRSLLVFGRKHVGKRRVGDLGAVVERVRTMLRQAVGETVKVVVSRPPVNEPIAVGLDDGQIQLALLNLAINARDAMPDGGELRVSVSAHSETRRARLIVSDTGRGMDSETQAHIFEPYFTTRASSGGTGLGLATVHGIVLDHGGTITVDSEVGVGTRFVIELPMTDMPVDAVAPERARLSYGGTDRILVVEDDPAVRRAIVRSLSDHHYKVDDLASAEEALRLSDGELSGYALLLSDVRLTGMDGIALADAVRERVPGITILLTSGYIEEGRQRETLAARRYAFVPKPFTPAGLAHAVRDALDGDARG